MTLSVEHVIHDYGRLRTLDGINAQAPARHITAVLGPNAAGKSTLLRLAIGAIVPGSGAVMVDGKPAHRLRGSELARRIAYVPQRPQVSASFTAREVVELGRYALPPSRQRVDAALRDVDLLNVADRPFPQLSAGQQQRAALARAVAQLEPEGNLVLDEPTSAMDLRHELEALALLRRLATAGATVLIAMHNLSLAAQVADTVWLLNEGRLVAAGPARQVMDVDLLRKVFEVNFEWLTRPGKAAVLMPGEDHPMPKLVWIFVVAMAVWQIIAKVADQANQKQRQKKIMESAGLGRPTPEPATPVEAPVPDRRKLDDLAARRRAQIEELRRRRELRLGPTGSPAPAPPRAVPPRPPAAPRPAAPVMRPAAAPPTARPMPVGRPLPAPMPRPEPPARPTPRPAEPVVASQVDELHTDDLGEPERKAPKRPGRTGDLKIVGTKLDRALLRRIVVMREVLGPPVSMRDGVGWQT